ncbi:MAG: co-chaperone YbbN [Ilumatobacter sp.]|nr:MAG: co-chaperone YbbN [Ilumatobacter sp.]
MAIDVTDARFETDIIERSRTQPVVVDLWATWCGPCTTLGPIIESVVEATNGAVVLAKVDVDQNPAIAQAFRVQSIPAVFAIVDGQVVDGFTGAMPQHAVEEFVARLLPSESGSQLDGLVAAGDELSLRAALDIDPGHEPAVIALAELLVGRGDHDEALALLARIPENDETRRLAAAARLGSAPPDDHDATLTALLERVKTDDDARQQFLDILELMGPHDPRTAAYRRQLTAVLF